MSFSVYELTVPVMSHGLGVLSEYLHKAATYAAEKKIEPAVLVNARLAPDMLPLSKQIQIYSDTCKGALGRMAGVEIPSFPDTETTFAELQERIAKTLAFVKTISETQLEGAEDRTIELKFGSFHTSMSGHNYLCSMVLPNLFFHLTTAHDILRHNGLNIGKMDYLGLN